MLEHSEVHANVLAADLKRARTFYTETLGLTPSREDDYTVRFPTPSGSWCQIYETSYVSRIPQTRRRPVYPPGELHLVMDNYGTSKRIEVLDRSLPIGLSTFTSPPQTQEIGATPD
jgi:catechol 2,3-dioxygenase-like lactoylglutathione lyase family enzyme